MSKIVKSILACFLLCATWQVNGQQVSNPGLNIPTTDSPGAGATVPYPMLDNITGISTFNLVRTTTPDQPLQSLTGSNVKYRQRADYFDGLGRPLQSVDRKGLDGNDIVQHHVYDKLGRERYSYLPFAVPNSIFTAVGNIKTGVNTALRNFYDQAGPDEQPYSRTDYDDGQQGKVIKQLQPGRSWVGSNRGSQLFYRHNVANEVRLWDIGMGVYDLPVTNRCYAAYELAVTQVNDEDGKIAFEYKDKDGLLILKKVQLEDGHINPLLHINYACTYYVYDEQKRLRFVIPPKAVLTMDVTMNGNWDLSSLTGLCFRYFYDERGMLIQKTLPGKELEEFIYDKRDRLILTQDGNLRAQNLWAFTFYDAINRPVITGQAVATVGRQAIINYLNDNVVYPPTDLLYYIKNYDLMYPYPASLPGVNLLSYTYYDNYAQLPAGYGYVDSLLTHYMPSPSLPEIEYPVVSQLTRGLVTGTKVRVMDPQNPTAEQWITTANYYDNKGRLLQAVSNDHWGGMNINSQLYYFQGMPYKNIDYYRNTSAKAVANAIDGPTHKYIIETSYSRNLVNGGGNAQVKKIEQQINGGPIFNLANYDYDHLGRVVIKDYRAGLVRQDYNMRGFLTVIDAEDNSVAPFRPIFEERIRYDWGFASKLYNGNIAGIEWRGADNKPHAYGYSYDKLDRLTHAEYRFKSSSSWIKTIRDYTVSNIKYDLNGNLTGMRQRGGHYPGVPQNMDLLTYSYETNSNKLKAVHDEGDIISGLPDFKNGATSNDEYGYDANGNMTRDDNKKIQSITYNHLNKPEIITTDSGSIYYVYDAAGNLRQKRINKGGIVEKYDYCNKIIFKDSIPQYILNEEGRARPVANVATGNYTRYVYDYFIKDHLGNVRSTITASPINQAYFAQHEIATANVEQLVFDNIPNVRDTKPGSGNPNDGMAAHLVASDPDQRVGTAIMLKVMPGDKFSISAKTYYEGAYTETEETGSGPALESLLSALMGGGTYAGVPVSELPENIQAVQGIFANPALASRVADIQAINNDPAVPKAHLNYLFFNDNFELQPDMSGAIQVQPNTGGGWQSTGNHNPCNCTTVATPGGVGYLVVYVDNQSIGKDVWFDDIHLEHYTSSVLEESHYYPFGLTVQTLNNNTNTTKQPYKLTTKELETSFDLNMCDFGARRFDMTRGQWTSIDPLAEKYYSYSPYSFCMDNPIKYFDPNGKEVWINYGKNQRAEYKEGKLYNEDGSAYAGKVNGFLKQSVNALDKISKSKTGAALIAALSESTNVFDIKSSSENPKKQDEFVPFEPMKAYANLHDPEHKRSDLSGGSGGTIYWNLHGTAVETTKGPKFNSETNLAHEMSHGYDADRGLMDNQRINGLKQNEYSASYRENLIRSELQLPLRTGYKIINEENLEVDVPLLDSKSQPIMPTGYKP